MSDILMTLFIVLVSINVAQHRVRGQVLEGDFQFPANLDHAKNSWFEELSTKEGYVLNQDKQESVEKSTS